jgi:hypothetical protein
MREAIADGDANRQYEQIQNFIAQRVHEIIIAPKDAQTVIPTIRAANEGNIPIVLYNRPPGMSNTRSVAVVPDNYGLSIATVDYLAEQARKRHRKHKAMILMGDLSDSNGSKQREKKVGSCKSNSRNRKKLGIFLQPAEGDPRNAWAMCCLPSDAEEISLATPRPALDEICIRGGEKGSTLHLPERPDSEFTARWTIVIRSDLAAPRTKTPVEVPKDYERLEPPLPFSISAYTIQFERVASRVCDFWPTRAVVVHATSDRSQRICVR